MHIAILITNTDFGTFAAAHPDDGEKFATLLREQRPTWRFTTFWVCKGQFPAEINGFDGVVITGSPASVTEDAPWMRQLSALILAVIAAGQPIFGACFGHQLIAQTLGAAIIRNPNGWGHGRLPLARVHRLQCSALCEHLTLYGSHIEQVASAPPNTTITFCGPGLPIAGFAQGRHLYTIQHHPEMTHEFIAALVEEYAETVGPHITEQARASLVGQADRALFAGEIARFFEGGQ